MRLPLSQKIDDLVEFGSYRLDWLTRTLWLAGDFDLNKANRVSPLAMTQLHAFLGERGEATRWLAEAVEQRLPVALFVKRHPMYDSLHGHPKFEELMKRMGI